MFIAYIFSILLLCQLTRFSQQYQCDDDSWIEFKKSFSKRYNDGDEDSRRYKRFCDNIAYINDHNDKNKNFSMRLNRMADWLPSELDRTIGRGLRHNFEEITDKQRMSSSNFPELVLDTEDIPDHVDWSQVPNRVGPVAFQGDCGACWAFTTTGLLEGQQVVRTNTNKLVPLSAQNLVDCDDTSLQCTGGNAHMSLYYIDRAGGIESEKDYPYVSYQTGLPQNCRFNKSRASPISTMVDGPIFIDQGDEEMLKRTVAKYGPVAVSIYAERDFLLYHAGVYYNPDCINFRTNHAVLVVGYGSTKWNQDYWIIKNSWGQDWGQSGFGMMSRNRDNNCGIASKAVIARFK